MLQVPFDKAQINTTPVMATVSLLCLKPVNRAVPWCFPEKSNCVYTPPTEPRCIPIWDRIYTISADANKSVYSRLIPMEARLDTVSSRSIPFIAYFATVTLLLMPVLSRFKFMRIKLPDHVDISHLVKTQQRCHPKEKGWKLEKSCAYNAFRGWGTWNWTCTSWRCFPTLI
jgi:hypothetical protein